jgi:uncharacterized membrane protein YraQ (UPF0718 family)
MKSDGYRLPEGMGLDRKRLKEAAMGAAKPLWMMLPALCGVILLISMLSVLVPKTAYSAMFSGNAFLDPLIGAGLGSVMAGNAVTSYVLGGEFLALGISLVAVTAFIISWVTVGIVQLPAEILMLGRRFAITRNVMSFVLSIIIAIIVVLLMGVFA